MHKIYPLYLLAAVLIAACSSNKQMTTEVVNLDTIEIKLPPDRPVYNASEKRVNDLLHTKLDVKFDWEKQYLYGKANLTFTPYFYPTKKLTLDAKGFNVNKVAIKKEEEWKDLTYTYDSLQIHAELDKEYTRNDTFEIFVDYTAKPNELPEGGSAAITSDKGLYFINPLGEEEGKPKQIWTQGETEASSCWFPTIDSPNERTTQELCMTVDKKYVTLSNGLMEFSTENEDGTRTDCWTQDQPHAPYLFMMAVGDFHIEKDKWAKKDKSEMDVDYYVEHEYGEHAKAIFGKTPEMLEFYSNVLGVEYPWKKYSQIVVRDYVSGAMENTSAVIHGDFLHQTKREMIDGDNEDIIAHELFHHWFGDLVTCESWANLPLNESFATYGEYLWQEHKHGREAADRHLQGNLNTYLQDARIKRVDMIRFDYGQREEMFDGHSYSKGGRILHMLRSYVGDEAFFEGLRVYLEDNKYTAVEIHNLRLAFEKVTGEDLNWFFNQWFLSAGHPDLHITYDYDATNKQQIVNIEQKQDFEETPVYKLPIAIDIYYKNGIERKEVILEKVNNELVFDVKEEPVLVNVEADKMLLCVKTDEKPVSAWIAQYYRAPLYLDRYEAIDKCGTYSRKDSLAAKVVMDALTDKNHALRNLAIRNLKAVVDDYPEMAKMKLSEMGLMDDHPSVRATAIRMLSNYFDDDESLTATYQKAINDSSYNVLGNALQGLAEVNPEQAMQQAKKLEAESSPDILASISRIYAEVGTDAENDFFMKRYNDISGFSKISFLTSYDKYLRNEERSEKIIAGAIDFYKEIGEGSDPFYVKIFALQGLRSIKDYYGKQEYKLNNEIRTLEKETPDNTTEINKFQNELDNTKNQKKKVEQIIEEVTEESNLNNVRVTQSEE